MKMTDMRAKARAIFGPAIAEPMPKQPNGAKALQERANARPIPTYKVGGVVKKQKPPQPTAAERAADRKRREEYAKMKVTKEQGAAIARGNRAADIEGGRYKKGGKVQTSADTAKKLATEMGGMKKGGKAKKDGLAVMIAIGSPMKGMKNMKKPVKKAVGGRTEGRNMKGTPVGPTAGQVSAAMQRMMGNQALVAPKNATIQEKIAVAKSMPSTGKARFVVNYDATPVERGTAKTRVAEIKAEAERQRRNAPPPDVIPRMLPPATGPGYKKGGAIMKKAAGGRTEGRNMKGTPIAPTQGQANAAYFRMQGANALQAPKGASMKDMEAISAKSIRDSGGKRATAVTEYDETPVARGTAKKQVIEANERIKNFYNTRPVEIRVEAPKKPENVKPEKPTGYKKGGAMMKPVKRAAGGAAKVRKGMMSPEGKIIDAMNKIRGK